MAEFNDRELKIIHMMTTLQNPLIKDAPNEMKKTIVSMTLKMMQDLKF